jgi:hypothetical protein
MFSAVSCGKKIHRGNISSKSEMDVEAQAPQWLVRWTLKLVEYDFEIVYGKGSDNNNANALSRLPIEKLSRIVTKWLTSW